MSRLPEPEFVSIGPYCETALILYRQGLRNRAYPFDYIFSSLALVRHCIADGFKTFLDRSQYIRGGKRNTTRHATYCTDEFLHTPVLTRHHERHYPHVPYIPARVNMFNHHRLLYNPAHYEAFVRRADRFMKLLESTDPVVFVYYNRYTREFDDLVDFYTTVVSKYSHIHLLGIFENDGDRTVLYEEGRCKIYQNYEFEEIFATAGGR